MSDFNTPAEATPSASPAASPQTSPTPSTAIPSSSPAPATSVPQEDRSNWVPPYRLRETTQRYEQTLQSERQQWQRELEQREARIRALVGVTPPENPQIDEVKKQFGQVFPGLSKLEAQAAQVDALLAQREEMDHLRQHVWAMHNKNAMDTLYKAAAETYGEQLSDDSKRSLGAAFIGYLNTNPDEYARYQNDPSVVVDFWKSFTGRFIDPVRRQATAASANRIPSGLPQDTPSGSVNVSSPAPKAANEDELLARALSVYKANSRYGFGE